MVLKRMVSWVLLLMITGNLLAQDLDEVTRRWAISGSYGGTKAVITENTMSSGSPLGNMTALSLEYYIPHTRFSLRGGYSGEDLDLAGDFTMQNIELGGRYYLLPQRFSVQPFGGISGFVNLTERSSSGVTGRYSQGPRDKEAIQDYECRYRNTSPLLSVAPVVGADFYILSCLAVTVDYSFRMGIDGRMYAEYDQFRPVKKSGVVRSNGMRHTFSVGLKINFPFGLTEKDGNSILQSLHEAIFGY